MNLVVFDIDGTLVDSAAFDTQLYVAAVKAVLGIEIRDDWTRYANPTDAGILAQILDEYALREEDRATEVKDTFVRLVGDYVRERNGTLAEIPGAKRLVDELSAHGRVAVAIATGGWRESAEMKLRGIGLEPAELTIASSSDAVSRVEILRLAEQRALSGQRATRRTYFGDGPWDKKACEQLDFDFIGVGDNVEHPIRFRDLSCVADILAELGLGS